MLHQDALPSKLFSAVLRLATLRPSRTSLQGGAQRTSADRFDDVILLAFGP